MPYRLAIDPGGTTGLAFRMPGKDGPLMTATCNSAEDLWAYFMPDMPKLDQVICEEWQYFKGIVTPAGTFTADLVASIRGICHVLSIPLALRTPISRTSYMPQATAWYKAERTKKRTNKMDSHEIDALAHLMNWEARYANG